MIPSRTASPRPLPAHPRRRRAARGFTLMEVMLAAILGAMVVFACLGLFSLINRQQQRQQLFVRETREISFTHGVFQRSMQLLLLSDKPQTPGAGGNMRARPADEDSAGEEKQSSSGSARTGGSSRTRSPSRTDRSATGRTRESDAAAAALAAAEDRPDGRGRDPTHRGDSSSRRTTGRTGSTSAGKSEENTEATAGLNPVADEEMELPRFILEEDHSQPAVMHSPDGILRYPQRFEVALRATPAFVEPPIQAASWSDSRRDRRTQPPRRPSRLDRSEEDKSPEGVEAAPVPGQDWQIADGVRGVFELTLDDPAPDQTEPTWTLWWRPIASATTAEDPAGLIGGDGTDPRDKSDRPRSLPGTSLANVVAEDPYGLGRAKLASGLLSCRWEAYHKRKFVPEYSFLEKEDVPAYVRMSIATVSGIKLDWVFEVGWSMGPEPGTVVNKSTPGGAPAGVAAGDQEGDQGQPGEKSGPAKSGGEKAQAPGPITPPSRGGGRATPSGPRQPQPMPAPSGGAKGAGTGKAPG